MTGWGVIAHQVSTRSDRRRPPWHQPRDRRVPPPPATSMHLKLPCANQGAINLSAPSSGFPSRRWLRTMNQTLLSSCVFSSTSNFGIMNSIRRIHSCIHPWPSPPADCTPPSCSFATSASFQRLQAYTTSQTCRDKGGNPSAARLAAQSTARGSLDPRLHPLTTLHPHHLPRHPLRRQSGLSLSSLPPLSSPFACRLEWFDLSDNSLGFNPGPLSDLASTSQPIPVAPPNSSRTHQPIRPQPNHIVPKHRVKALEPAMDHNKSLTPTQTQHQAQNCKKALQFCKAWSLNYDRAWTTCTSGWRSWMGRQRCSCKCSQHCREHATPLMEKQMPQGMSR
jgi:hypothetical protein